MPSQPKVTVILTSYNHAKYLRESIESILLQTYADFDLIIGDDASSDNSWDIIKSYDDPRIRSFRHEKTKGGFIINEAISDMETGMYIAIQHSDDIWEPDKLEKQVAFLDENPEVGAVFTWAKIVDEYGSLLMDKNHFYYNIFDQPNRSRYEWLNYFFDKGNALCHPSVLIRKKCYEECGVYRPGLTQAGDFDMWIRVALKYKLYILQDRLVRFRVRQNDLNSSGDRPSTRVRGQFEYLQLLNHYRKIHDFETLKKIFPEAEGYERNGQEDIGFILGIIATSKSRHAFTTLFGLNLLFEAINDPVRADKIKRLYGFSQLKFIELTAKYDVFSVEKIKMLNNLITQRDEELTGIKDSKAWQMIENLRVFRAFVMRSNRIKSE